MSDSAPPTSARLVPWLSLNRRRRSKKLRASKLLLIRQEVVVMMVLLRSRTCVWLLLRGGGPKRSDITTQHLSPAGYARLYGSPKSKAERPMSGREAATPRDERGESCVRSQRERRVASVRVGRKQRRVCLCQLLGRQIWPLIACVLEECRWVWLRPKRALGGKRRDENNDEGYNSDDNGNNSTSTNTDKLRSLSKTTHQPPSFSSRSSPCSSPKCSTRFARATAGSRLNLSVSASKTSSQRHRSAAGAAPPPPPASPGDGVAGAAAAMSVELELCIERRVQREDWEGKACGVERLVCCSGRWRAAAVGR